MEKWKPTKVWARDNLKRVNKLIESYKLDESPFPCPICIYVPCKECVWTVFTGETCDGYDKIPIKKRLPRLYGWKVRLNNIIKKGA